MKKVTIAMEFWIIAMVCVASSHATHAGSEEPKPEQHSVGQPAGQVTVPESIEVARAAVAADNKDARAHLQLGQAIGAVLQADPMQGVAYAAEMLKALQTALDLDPEMPEAYHWLAGYYLNAPPIAGGSVDRAKEIARRLAKIDSDEGARLLAQIEQHGESSGSN